jgi:predicted nucleic acid-binding protein
MGYQQGRSRDEASLERAAAYVAAVRDRERRWSGTWRPALRGPADADDDYLIALAQTHGADAVVSGDRHLLDVASSELSVLTPRELADRLGLVPVG